MNNLQVQPVIISGPSGAGKTTVVRGVLEQSLLPLVLSISCTTRVPRPDEQDGVNYHFLTKEEFDKRRQVGDFLECKQVFGSNWYGTLRSEVTTGLSAGKFVVLEIDVHGALSALSEYPEAVTIFIHPGSLAELEKRLRARDTDSPAAIQRRLEVARGEMELKDRYRFEVINDDLDRAVHEICDILSHSGEKTQCSKN